MPLNQQHIAKIILNECNSIEERCDGYRGELAEIIIEIIALERQHRLHGTNIQQKINDKCKATGDFLAEQRVQV